MCLVTHFNLISETWSDFAEPFRWNLVIRKCRFLLQLLYSILICFMGEIHNVPIHFQGNVELSIGSSLCETEFGKPKSVSCKSVRQGSHFLMRTGRINHIMDTGQAESTVQNGQNNWNSSHFSSPLKMLGLLGGVKYMYIFLKIQMFGRYKVYFMDCLSMIT